jgi:hypothetical protein
MNKFIVQHVIISHKEDGTPRLMSLHIPIDGVIRVHTIMPFTPMFNSILNKLGLGKPIILEAHFVQVECPIHYALITDEVEDTIVNDVE